MAKEHDVYSGLDIPRSIRPPATDTLTARFAHACFRSPRRMAVVDTHGAISYRMLAQWSDSIAAALASRRLGQGDLIGVELNRGREAVAAILGVLRTRACAVPIDPGLPRTRINQMIDIANIKTVISDTSYEATVPVLAFSELAAETGSPAISAHPRPDDAAYVLFTSGSTGVPRPVMVTHRNILAMIDGFDQIAPMATPAVGAALCPLSFDVAMWEHFSVLSGGGTLHVIDRDALLNSSLLTAEFHRRSITSAYVPPGVIAGLVEAISGSGHDLPLHRVLVGVEPIPASVLHDLLKALPRLSVVNGYGPTETAVCASLYRVTGDEGEGRTPIGYPVPGYTITLVNERFQPVPDGDIGEVVIGGSGVALGYWRDAPGTAERFLPDPYSGDPGSRVFRTGDLARRLPSGALEFIGRRDRQVKVRGFRVELGEVSGALDTLPGIHRGAVELIDGTLLAFAETAPGTTGSALRAELATRLPRHALPARVITCDRFQETAHGKIDRDWLRRLARRRPLATPSAPPATAAERTLARLFADVVGLDEVGAEDDFFDLGGDSLHALELTRRVARQFGAAARNVSVLRDTTPRALAAAIAHAADRAVARQADRLSLGERGLWAMQSLHPDNHAFMLPVALSIECTGGQDTVVEAFRALARRHEAFRTRFELRDKTVRRVIGDAVPELAVIEAVGEDPSHVAERLVRDGVMRRIDLSRHAFNASLARLGDHSFLLVLAIHHIIFDGWSVPIMVRDLRDLLDGEDGRLPVPSGPSLATATADPDGFQEGQAWWDSRFSPQPPALELYTDRSRPSEPSGRGLLLRQRYGSDILAGVEKMSAALSVSPFTLILAALTLLFRRYTGSDDIVISTVSSSREDPGTEHAIGYFVDLLPLRLDVSGNPTVREFIHRVQRELGDAHAHRNMSFDALTRSLYPNARVSPLTRVVVADDVDPGVPVRGRRSGIDLIECDPRTAKYELTVFIRLRSGTMELCWEYATDLFDTATIERFADNFRVLLTEIVASAPAEPRINTLTALPDTDRAEVTAALNPLPSPEILQRTTTDLFAEQARTRPDELAVVAPERSASFADLDRESGMIAALLMRQGVRPGDPVAIYIERSASLIAATLATLKCGAYYVPIDIRNPPARLAEIGRAASAAIVLTSQRTSSLAAGSGLSVVTIEQSAGLNPMPPLPRLPSSTCYAMFTSGSTGTPKGVLIPDRGVVRLVRDQNYYDPRPDDRFALVANYSFDVSAWEIWGALLNGAAITVFDEETLRDPAALCTAITESRVTIGFFTPAVFGHLLDANPRALSTFRMIFLGGEVVPPALAQRAANLLEATILVNGYGPTENSTYSCCCHISDDVSSLKSLPIGLPIANSTAYVVDRDLEPLPVNALGEIVVGGAGLAHGYLANPRSTAEKFVPDPFSGIPGARLYRTGDFGRVLANGMIEYAGRVDDQVKIRGHRVELAEAERVVTSLEGIRRGAVVAIGSSPGTQLVAYVEAAPGLTGSLIRDRLAASVPDYLVPRHVVLLPELPRNGNGKIDRASLRKIPFRQEQRVHASEPTNATERRLATIWRDILGIDEPGIDDGFIDLGGDSLALAVLQDRVREEFGTTLPITVFFEAPSIRLLAERLRAGQGEESPADAALAHRVSRLAATRRAATRPEDAKTPGGTRARRP